MATGRLLLKEKSLGNTLKITIDLSTRVNLWLSIAAPMLLFGLHIVTINSPFATKIVDGNIDDLNAALYEELLAKIDFPHVNKSIIIKGCSQKPVPSCLYCRTIFTTLCP
jgi:hypothetical protein